MTNIFNPLSTPSSSSMQNIQNIYQTYKYKTNLDSKANFGANFYQHSNEFVDGLLEKTASDDQEYEIYLPVMKRISCLRHRNIIKESLEEINRRGSNFACIFPAAGCEIYDKFFTAIRPLNKLLMRVLYHDDLDFEETANHEVKNSKKKVDKKKFKSSTKNLVKSTI